MNGDESDGSSKGILRIEQLFNTSWYRQEKMGKWWLFCYAPFGILLLLVRFGILFQFFLLKLILPKSRFKTNVLRIMGGILGVTVSSEGKVATAANFVANRVTLLDPFIIHFLTDGVYFVGETKVPQQLHSLLGITTDLGRSNQSLIYFPEGTSTNAIGGLLTFCDISGDRSMEGRLVHPVAIQASRPFINVNTIDGGPLTEIFLTLFSFNTHFKIKFLPSEPWNGAKIQSVIASSLAIQPTKFKRGDKDELLKKLNFRPLSMASMARLVQQQLHPVVLSPESVIAAIQKTGSVEEAVKELRKSMAQPSFHKSASERMMCFQERKRLLIQSAREKYAQKHGITIT